MIVGVSPVYYDLTHRLVKNLDKKGLELLAKESSIPFNDLKEFKDKKKIDGAYMPALYSNIFGKRTFVQANLLLEELGF